MRTDPSSNERKATGSVVDAVSMETRDVIVTSSCTAAESVELASRVCRTGAKLSSLRRFSFGTRCSQKAIASALYLRRISVFTPEATFHGHIK